MADGLPEFGWIRFKCREVAQGVSTDARDLGFWRTVMLLQTVDMSPLKSCCRYIRLSWPPVEKPSSHDEIGPRIAWDNVLWTVL